MTYEGLVDQLAQRPKDRALHAVLADWLLERGDSRGEALALELAGAHSKLAQLRKKQARLWLGELGSQVDLERCAFYGAFPTKLSFKRGAAPEALLRAPPTVRHLAADWRALAALAGAGRRFSVLEVVVGLGMAFSDFRALADELDLVATIDAEALVLVLDSFVGEEAALFLAMGFLRSALCSREKVTLDVRQGSLDAARAWLCQAGSWGGGSVWGARWSGAEVQASRDEQGRFRRLALELAFEDERPLKARLASGAALLSQLRGLSPSEVTLRVWPEQRVGRAARQSLDAALRLLPGVGSVKMERQQKVVGLIAGSH